MIVTLTLLSIHSGSTNVLGRIILESSLTEIDLLGVKIMNSNEFNTNIPIIRVNYKNISASV